MLKLRASLPNMLTAWQWSEHAFAHRSQLGGEKGLLPRMNNLFRAISLFQESKIHEHMQVSFLLERRTNGILAYCFIQFCRKLPITTRRNGQFKPGKLLNPIPYFGNKPRPCSISLHWYLGSSIFSHSGRFFRLNRYENNEIQQHRQ